MNATVDRLSAELTDRYVQYLETFLVDLSSDESTMEFRCGFTLRSDHLLHSFKLEAPVGYGDTAQERDIIIAIIFEQIDEVIDETIAQNRPATN